MTVNEIIKLLDKEENKYGGATGKERELNLSIDGDFVGTVRSATLDGWGDGLVTDVTLELNFKYKIRNEVIDELLEKQLETLEDFKEWEDGDGYPIHSMSEKQRISKCKELIKQIAEQLKAGGRE